MMRLVGDGLCNDLLLSVYDELGLPLSKPFTLGCVTPTVISGYLLVLELLTLFLVVEVC